MKTLEITDFEKRYADPHSSCGAWYLGYTLPDGRELCIETLITTGYYVALYDEKKWLIGEKKMEITLDHSVATANEMILNL